MRQQTLLDVPDNDLEARRLKDLLRSLRRDETTQKVTQALTEGGTPPPETVECLIDALRDASLRHEKRRTLAAWSLGRMPLTPEQRAEVIAALHDLITKRSSPPRIKKALRKALLLPLIPAALCSGLILALLLSFVERVGLSLWPLLGGLSLTTFFFWLAFTACLGPFLYDSSSEQHRRTLAAAAATLGRLDAMEEISVLAQTVMHNNPQIRLAAAEALKSTLPLLTEEHYGALNSETVPALCRILGIKGLVARNYNDEEFNLLLLEALGKIGDGRAVPFVQRAAAMAWTAPLRQAATAILPTLEARREKENEYGMLLRGAAMPLDPPDTLLRPAFETPDTAPEQLLRPTSDAPDGGNGLAR